MVLPPGPLLSTASWGPVSTTRTGACPVQAAAQLSPPAPSPARQSASVLTNQDTAFRPIRLRGFGVLICMRMRQSEAGGRDSLSPSLPPPPPRAAPQSCRSTAVLLPELPERFPLSTEPPCTAARRWTRGPPDGPTAASWPQRKHSMFVPHSEHTWLKLCVGGAWLCTRVLRLMHSGTLFPGDRPESSLSASLPPTLAVGAGRERRPQRCGGSRGGGCGGPIWVKGAVGEVGDKRGPGTGRCLGLSTHHFWSPRPFRP